MANEKLREQAERLLAPAEVAINGPNPWDIQVHDERLFARVFAEGTLGFGEAYMDGWWDSEQLDETMARILGSGAQHLIPRNLKTLRLALMARWTNRQNKKRVWDVGDQHYNLGNDLFAATFDSRITGSCGYWKEATDLDAAQDAKLDLICRKIGLQTGQSVFDIGCGWGAFMGFAAEKYGAHCTGVTISEEQVNYISERYSHLPVRGMLMDYRDATGRFDHVVSMGMFEHVGPHNYRVYFETAERLLDDGGFFLLHTIGSNKSAKRDRPVDGQVRLRERGAAVRFADRAGDRGTFRGGGLAQLRRGLRQDIGGVVREVPQQLGLVEGAVQ